MRPWRDGVGEDLGIRPVDREYEEFRKRVRRSAITWLIPVQGSAEEGNAALRRETCIVAGPPAPSELPTRGEGSGDTIRRLMDSPPHPILQGDANSGSSRNLGSGPTRATR